MSDDIHKALAGIVETQKQILKLAHEAKVESATLQAVCASIIAEIASLDAQPKQRLNQILAGLEGSGAAVASSTNSPHTTETIERISAMAEALIPCG